MRLCGADCGEMGLVDGLRWSCRAAGGRQDAAGDACWPVWREVWGTFGWLVGEGEVGATVSGAAVRLGVACLAIGPGRH